MTARALVAAALLAAPLAASAGTRPREAVHPSYGVRLGAVTAVSNAAGETRTGAGGGAYALFDIPGLLADVSVDLYPAATARLLAGGIGAYYPVLDGETTPYLGGGLKLGWARFGGDGAFGLQPFAAAGLLIGRSWSPHIRLEVAWFFTTASEERVPGGPGHRANGPIATFGIGF